jgi:hypothetical protein
MVKTAWHFVGETLRDDRPIPADGEWLVHEGPIKMCAAGLHASYDPFDALKFAPGPVLCKVEVDGIEGEESDKIVCRRRRVIARRDVTETLCYFARMQAVSVVHLWDAPDVVLDYLMTGDDSLRIAARDAAWVAARDDAWIAARAYAAAYAAAMAAARGAVNAAWDATVAAWAAAMAADGAARENFNQLIAEQMP